MSITTGQQALIRRIVTMTGGTNVVLPNGPDKGLPRYVVQVSGGGQRAMGLSQQTDAKPEIVVRVETVDGEYTTENDQLVAALVARFNNCPKFDGVVIESAPQVRPPIQGGGVYAVPVVITGRFFF